MPADPPFLGTGWAFPPAFGRGGAEVGMVSGAEDVHQSLRVLLSTAPGERVMAEDFGCDLRSAAFEEIDQGLINSVTGIIADAILLYEPRVTLEQLDVSAADAVEGLVLITLTYTIRSTNSRYNMVFPYYLSEAATTAA
jgi:phage baseplate assembly protein W